MVIIVIVISIAIKVTMPGMSLRKSRHESLKSMNRRISVIAQQLGQEAFSFAFGLRAGLFSNLSAGDTRPLRIPSTQLLIRKWFAERLGLPDERLCFL